MLDAPRFLPLTPADNFNFKAVALDINAGSENESILREVPPILPALHQWFPRHALALVFPCLGEEGVDPSSQRFIS